MNATPSIERYDVVQRELAFDILTDAMSKGTYVEYDLVGDTGMIHVIIDITATAHDDQDTWRLIGKTTDFQTINVIFARTPGGKLEATGAMIVTTER